MEGQELAVRNEARIASSSFREFVLMGFRHQRVVTICFFGILAGAILAGLFWPKYRSESEILVRRDRIDPMISPQQNVPVLLNSQITEEELNSEVELIKSDDVLRRVVQETGLDKHQRNVWGWLTGHPQNEDKRMSAAVRRLESHLSVEALPRTDIIKITYLASDPHAAAQVLSTLDRVYVEKHQAMHRPSGQFKFFDQETTKAKSRLASAEAQLRSFAQSHNVANPDLNRDIAIQKLNDFNASLGQTNAAIADTEKRITTLEGLAQATPARLTTQVRHEDDAPVLQQLKSKLMELELTHVDLAARYQPDYPPVIELDKQIAETKAAIAAEKPLLDETTDQNPTYEWLDSELAKARAELRGNQARAAATEKIIRQNMAAIQQLDQKGIQQHDLIREAKVAEDDYLLYLHKREEARITDALDQNHILNVAIAEQPTIPGIPAQSPLMFGLLGLVLAATVSTGVVFTLEYLDPSFRTPNEIEAVLHVPVLGAVPYSLPAKPNDNEPNASNASVNGDSL